MAMQAVNNHGVWSHLHASTHAILRTCVVCRTYKTLCGMLSQLFLIQPFSTLLITHFTISVVKLSVWLYAGFYLLFFFHIVTFGFDVAVTC